LREAVRARDEFVAIAAHELRNPMTPILMQVSSLLAATRDPRRCRPELIAPRMENLQLAVREFVRRSTTLLDISRITAGSHHVELAQVDFSQLVRRVVDRFGIAAKMARSSLQADLEEGVVGNWDRLALVTSPHRVIQAKC
jgi:signal transduction histidine kinase